MVGQPSWQNAVFVPHAVKPALNCASAAKSMASMVILFPILLILPSRSLLHMHPEALGAPIVIGLREWQWSTANSQITCTLTGYKDYFTTKLAGLGHCTFLATYFLYFWCYSHACTDISYISRWSIFLYDSTLRSSLS